MNNLSFELLTQKQFAAILHRKPNSINYLEQKYEDFPARIQIGKRSLFRLIDVEQWLQRRFEEAGIETEECEND